MKTFGLMEAVLGDKCQNSAWEDRWTCPGCYTDHGTMVTQCDGCGAPLKCEIEQQPVPVCTIRAEDEETD